MAFPNLPVPDQNASLAVTVKAMFQWLTGGGNNGAGIPVTSPSVTQNPVSVGASASGTIPAGAKGWTFVVLTGTATFGGVASLPAGFSDSSDFTLKAAIAYSTDSGSSAYVRYGS